MGSWTLEGGGVVRVSQRKMQMKQPKHESAAPGMRFKNNAESVMRMTRFISVTSAGWVLADWVNTGQTGPSWTKVTYHVSFQGSPEVSRQMGMEMSQPRAHFNLAPHS